LAATDGVAGQFRGRLFADHGADVVLLETPAGSRVRGEDDLFWHLNCGKRAMAGDPRTLRGEDLDAVPRGLDVVIIDQNTARFDWNPAEYPRLVVCSISDFGETGPYASWQGSELV
jgi:crotonobetainyl-CoA:carnitine CoA-transferase CaiB-like acyl-CoA transferase